MRVTHLPGTLEMLAGDCPPGAGRGGRIVNIRFARLGMLAVGLGIWAAWAHTPVAAADSSSDWLSSIDGLLSGALPAADPSGLNLAISFDGMSLIQDGNATATTASGEFGLAIAYGDGATATAEGGTGNYALADGAGAIAAAGGSPVRPATTSTAPSTSAPMQPAASSTAPTPARASLSQMPAAREAGAAAMTPLSRSVTTPPTPPTTAPTPVRAAWSDWATTATMM